MTLLTSAIKHKKILITGLGRSGTSAVASIASQLGYFMPNVGNLATHEDEELRELLKNGDVAKIKAVLERRVAENEFVAWKDPKLFSVNGASLQRILDHDWLYVFVFRDPLCIAMRNNKSLNMDIDTALTSAVAMQQKMVKFYTNTVNKFPTYKFSYEKFMLSPDTELKMFCEFLGIDHTCINFDLLKSNMNRDHNRYITAQPI